MAKRGELPRQVTLLRAAIIGNGGPPGATLYRMRRRASSRVAPSRRWNAGYGVAYHGPRRSPRRVRRRGAHPSSAPSSRRSTSPLPRASAPSARGAASGTTRRGATRTPSSPAWCRGGGTGGNRSCDRRCGTTAATCQETQWPRSTIGCRWIDRLDLRRCARCCTDHEESASRQ